LTGWIGSWARAAKVAVRAVGRLLDSRLRGSDGRENGLGEAGQPPDFKDENAKMMTEDDKG